MALAFWKSKKPQQRLIEELYRDADLRISRAQGNPVGQKRVLVSFTGALHLMGGLDVDKPAFFNAGLQYDQIFFVNDLPRSWSNAFGLQRLESVLGPYLAGYNVDLIGTSMGGFNCILASGVLGARHCLAFGPQYSIHPDIVPHEKRWMEFRRHIKTITYRSLEGYFMPDCAYTVLFGTEPPDDIVQFQLFPKLPNLQCLALDGVVHNVALELKRQSILMPVINAGMQGEDLRPLFGEKLDADIRIRSEFEPKTRHASAGPSDPKHLIPDQGDHPWINSTP